MFSGYTSRRGNFMKISNMEPATQTLYREPEIVTVGGIVALTGAGGDKVVDAYGPDGHSANDWNIHNSQPPAPDDEIDKDALD